MIDDIITPEKLEAIEFKNNKKYRLPGVNLPYWVKNGICLFYHENEFRVEPSFLMGVAGMRMGEYQVVTLRWISRMSALRKFYEGVAFKPLEGVMENHFELKK